MNLKEYRTIFMMGTLALLLITNLPLITLIFPLTVRNKVQLFSEFYALGPEHTISKYPSNITIGSSEMIFIGVHNHLGDLAYYKVQMKFGNSTEFLPSKSESSPLSPLREFHFFLKNDGEWETPVNFSIQEASFSDYSSSVQLLLINGEIAMVNSSSGRDFESNGFYYYLFFELWLFKVESNQFEYHERFLSIALSLTD